uniref:Uncharacterized protein n=1 Tax=Mustela putorius furo TaxID=9669 RepID=M3YR92_MUSPF
MSGRDDLIYVSNEEQQEVQKHQLQKLRVRFTPANNQVFTGYCRVKFTDYEEEEEQQQQQQQLAH